MSTRRSVSLFFFFWILALFLGMSLHQNLGEGSSVPSPELQDPLSRLLGSAKEVFGDTLFVKADVYLHGGVMHERHHDDSAEAMEKEGIFREASGHLQTEPEDWVAKINNKIQAHELMHLSKEKRKEMLPFFALSTALDPYNVEAVLTSAYWLDHEFGKTEDALELLKKGALDNPSSWEIESALGRFYFQQKDPSLAERHWIEAVRKSHSIKIKNFERVDMFYHLGETKLILGKKTEALEAYQSAESYFDEKTTPFLQSLILGKIKELSGTV